MATNMKKKTERVEANREKRPYAVAKYIRVSPYKVRTVLALIRGKDYKVAKAILEQCFLTMSATLFSGFAPRLPEQRVRQL